MKYFETTRYDDNGCCEVVPASGTGTGNFGRGLFQGASVFNMAWDQYLEPGGPLFYHCELRSCEAFNSQLLAGQVCEGKFQEIASNGRGPGPSF